LHDDLADCARVVRGGGAENLIDWSANRDVNLAQTPNCIRGNIVRPSIRSSTRPPLQEPHSQGGVVMACCHPVIPRRRKKRLTQRRGRVRRAARG
jgi:hypothetical protein